MYVTLRSLSDFNETWILTDFEKNNKISNFMKIRPVAAELFHAEGQTDGQTCWSLTVVISNFVNTPKKKALF